MAHYTVLIVDDEQEIIEILTVFLEAEGFHVVSANDGKQACEAIKELEIDIVLLDVMMPQMDGFKVMKEIRSVSTIPVIFLTARVDASDKILGLQLGADDYIVKPFNPLEVVARISANLRRYYKLSPAEAPEKREIHYKEMRLDLDECVLYKQHVMIPLTSIEFKVLKLFMESPGRVFTKQQIYEAGWDQGIVVDDNSIMVCISKIRSKLGDDQNYITTIRGLGYRLEKHR